MITNSENLQRTSSISLEANISKRQLRWLRNVVRIEESRLPE